jgi:hypothetical protein
MHLLWWAIVVYEGVVGVAELTATSSTNTTLSSVAGLPSVGTLVGSMNTSSYIPSGALDLAVAAGVWYFAIHKK